MSAPNAERGVAPQRVDFVREDYLGSGTFGVTPTDPSFLKYSDAINTLNITPSAVIERRGGLGTADPVDFQRGPESHEIVVGYDLVKQINASGDASYDGLARQGDELLPDSHSLLVREDKTQVQSGATVAENTSRPTRLYLYGRGGLVNEGMLAGNPSEQQPVVVELTYIFQYLRAFQIDQPTSVEAPTEVVVKSTDSGDTGVAVEIEGTDDTDTYASETVTTDASDGTTIVSSTTTFQNIDVVYVSAANVGDIEVAINTGSQTSPTEGDTIAKVFGETTYSGVESDYGVPPLGSGSREDTSTLGAPENFIGDTIQADSSPYPYQIQAINLTWENGLEETAVSDQLGRALHPGNRTLNWESTIFGENASIDALQAHFQNSSRNMTWTLDNTTIDLSNTRLVEPGEVAKEEGQAVMTIENRWVAEGLTLS